MNNFARDFTPVEIQVKSIKGEMGGGIGAASDSIQNRSACVSTTCGSSRLLRPRREWPRDRSVEESDNLTSTSIAVMKSLGFASIHIARGPECSFGTSRAERVVPEPSTFMGLARLPHHDANSREVKQAVEHFCALVFRGVAVLLAHCRRAPSITLAAEIDATI